MGVGVRVRDPTRNLPRREGISLPAIEREDIVLSREDGVGKKAEKRRRIIAVLTLAVRIVDALAEEPAGRSRFETPTSNPSSRRLSLKVETVSPMRPPVWLRSPTWSRPRMNVPVVTTTVRERKRTPKLVSTPAAKSSSTSSRVTLPCLRSRCGCFSRIAFMRNWYAFLSHCARGARTLGPLRALSIRN